MNRSELTEQYLAEVKRRGVRGSDLVATPPHPPELHAYYHGRYLTRPLFLGHAEKEQLYADLANLRSALISLPDKLYGGDLAGFARAVGMTEVQVSAILRSRGSSVTHQGRADLYADASGFKLLELNLGSALGGIDNSDMCAALLAHPVLAEFAQTHRLDYVDTIREQARCLVAESGFPPGSRPVLATVDWPASYPMLEPLMRYFAVHLRALGIDPIFGHLGQLVVRDGGVWLGDRKVDIIQRVFMLEDLQENPEATALVDPLLDAAARGEVALFTPMDAELFASKGALAMLSDEANRHLFDQPQLASLDRILPWTRMVRPGPVTLEDGRRVDLLDYALGHQHDLALKPTSRHGGHGVLLGWRPDVTAAAWEEQVRAALDGRYVIQRRIRPVPELFPTDAGDPTPWIVSWGVITLRSGYGGVYARASSVESDVEILSLGTGAYSGSCLHALPPPTP